MSIEEQISKQEQIGRAVHRITYRWNRLIASRQARDGLDQETIVNGRILGFLHFSKENVYQKDIEKAVGLTKSAISNLLSEMERKGYIERHQVEGDARLRKVVLTPYGEEIHKKLENVIKSADENFVKGLSEAEQQEFIRMLDIIDRNMKEMEAEVK